MTAVLDEAGTVVAGPVRSRSLDALRGLAVLCMIADHVSLFAGYSTVRETVGRVAMPLFFVLGGHLVRRLSWRLVGIVAAGFALQALAPWSGAGMLLLSFGIGAVVCYAGRGRPWLLLAGIGWTLARAANGYPAVVDGAYDPGSLVALMALGALAPRPYLTGLTSWLPGLLARPLSLLGRFPLTVYAVHVLALTALYGTP